MKDKSRKKSFRDKKLSENSSYNLRMLLQSSHREMIDELRRMGRLPGKLDDPNKPQEDDKEFQAFMNN